jgi:sarcosine oxidase, subunit alpha
MQSTTKPQRLSPIHTYHESMDARFDLQAGWLIPDVYTMPEEESTALAKGVGLADISAHGKITVRGDLAYAVIAERWADVSIDPGEVSVVGSSNTLIANLTTDEFLILTVPGNEVEITNSFDKEISDQNVFVTVLDRTSNLVGLALQGPKSLGLMAKLCPLPLYSEKFPNLHVAQTSFAKTRTTIIRRDRDGALAFELYADRSYGGYLWEAILDAGADFGIGPVGWKVLV